MQITALERDARVKFAMGEEHVPYKPITFADNFGSTLHSGLSYFAACDHFSTCYVFVLVFLIKNIPSSI